MNCQSLRTWILQADSLQPKTWPAEVATHVKSCAGCVRFVNSLNKIEKAWRAMPMPASCNDAKTVFLSGLSRGAGAAPAPQVVPMRRWRPVRWAAAAAMVLIAVGILGWAVFSPSEVRASDLVDRLVEWNTDLARTDYAKRKQMVDAGENDFRTRLQGLRLSPEERASGEHLLAAAHKLADSDDLEDDEEIVTELAEALLKRARGAEFKGIAVEIEHCNRRYTLFVEKAVTPLNIRLRLIDRLIEFNMQIANAEAKKRRHLFEESEDGFRRDIDSAGLASDDRVIAEKLLELGRQFATSADPAQQALAVSEVADKLLDRAETAEKKGKKKESDRAAIGYSMFVEKALNPFFDKFKSMQPKGPPQDPKKTGFDFMKFQKQFEYNRQRAPQFNRPEMQRRFEAQTKKGPSGFKGGKK